MKRLLKALVSVALVVLAFSMLDWEGVGQAITRLEPAGMALAFVCCFSQFVFMGLRWYRLVRGHCSCRLLPLFKGYLYSSMLNTFTPANVGGDVYRYMQLRGKVSSGLTVLQSLIEERLLGLFSFLLTATACIAAFIFTSDLSSEAHWFFLMCLLGAVAGCVFLLLLPMLGKGVASLLARRFPGKTLDVIRREGVGTTVRLRKENLPLWLLSLAAVCVWIGTCWIVAEQVGVGLPLPMLGAVVVLVELLRLVPVSIQGIGVREGGFAYLAHLMGGDPESGFLCAAISYLLLNAVFCSNALLSLALPGDLESDQEDSSV